MLNLSAGVVTLESHGDRFLVCCNRCGGDLGVWDYETLRNAIFNTLGRGGVLCPGCRQQTCDVCGIGFSAGNLGMLKGPKGDVRGCAPCALFLSQQVEETARRGRE